jgi:hypothetical protein
MSAEHDRMDALLSNVIATADPELADRFDTDPDAFLQLVARTNLAYSRTANMLQSAVLAARGAGHSWEAIGQVLGITRQAAQQRFGPGAHETAEPHDRERRRLGGLTAFNEMEALEQAGRYGWHSVDYGPYFHMVERDTVQWEHRRVYAWSRNRGALEAEGWQMVGKGWFPWSYYARPTDTPAIEEDPSYEELVRA